MAVDEVNEKLLAPLGHSLDFVVAETYGQEEVSIKQVSLFHFLVFYNTTITCHKQTYKGTLHSMHCKK